MSRNSSASSPASSCHRAPTQSQECHESTPTTGYHPSHSSFLPEGKYGSQPFPPAYNAPADRPHTIHLVTMPFAVFKITKREHTPLSLINLLVRYHLPSPQQGTLNPTQLWTSNQTYTSNPTQPHTPSTSPFTQT